MPTRHNRGHSYRAPRLISREDVLKDDGDDTMTWAEFCAGVGAFKIPGPTFDFSGDSSYVSPKLLKGRDEHE